MEIQNIPGGYTCDPNFIRRFLSIEASALFELLNEKSYQAEESGYVQMTLANITKMRFGLGYRSVKSALEELCGLGLVEEIKNKGQKYAFRIIWDNVFLLSRIIQRILNYDGVNELRKKCSGIRVTDFEESVIEDICSKFPPTKDLSVIVRYCEKAMPGDDIIAKNQSAIINHRLKATGVEDYIAKNQSSGKVDCLKAIGCQVSIVKKQYEIDESCFDIVGDDNGGYIFRLSLSKQQRDFYNLILNAGKEVRFELSGEDESAEKQSFYKEIAKKQRLLCSDCSKAMTFQNFRPDCSKAMECSKTIAQKQCHLINKVYINKEESNNPKDYNIGGEKDVLSGKNQSSTILESPTAPMIFSDINSQENLNNISGKDSDGHKEIHEEELPDENYKIDFSKIKGLDQNSKKYAVAKNRSRLPFIPAEEVKGYVMDLTSCLDRADKIFIHYLWKNLQPFFIYEEVDEKEHVIENEQDPEGMSFYADRFARDILTPAYEDTIELIEKGKVTVRGTEYLVTCDPLNPEDVEMIVDFQLSTKEDGYVYTISTSRIKNIHADSVPISPSRKNIREGRSEDKAYMQQIILLGDDDNRYTELTSIELAIYNFLSEYFEINDDGSVEQPKQKFVNQMNLRNFYCSIKNKRVSEKDFLGVLFNNAPDKNDGSLNLKGRMFDSYKIREWNSLNGQKSIISIPDV